MRVLMALLIVCVSACSVPTDARWDEFVEWLSKQTGSNAERLRNYAAARATIAWLESKGRDIKVAGADCVDRDNGNVFGSVDVTAGDVIDECLDSGSSQEQYEFCVETVAFLRCRDLAVRLGVYSQERVDDEELASPVHDEAPTYTPGFAPDELPPECDPDKIQGDEMARAIVGSPKPDEEILRILSAAGLIGRFAILCPLAAGWGCDEPVPPQDPGDR